jgi:hypothetical protein
MHARRYFFKALESDEPHMGPAMHLIARLYAVEERAKTLSLSAQQRLVLRQRVSARLLGKLHQYLLELQPEVLPKSPSGAAVRYALNQWEALTRFLEDGELEIDNGATERANRDIALGRGNWTFFGSDGGGKTAACCEASSLPASGAASSRLPGSTMCSRASRRTLSPGSVNCFPTTGSQRFPQPKLKQAADTTNRGLSPVAVYETLTKCGKLDFLVLVRVYHLKSLLLRTLDSAGSFGPRNLYRKVCCRDQTTSEDSFWNKAHPAARNLVNGYPDVRGWHS